MLPFSTEQFFALFAEYNAAIWPAHVVAYVLAALALWAIVSQRDFRPAYVILGAYWLWNGLIYHLLFFTKINGAAYVFAALFTAQGLIFLVWTKRPRTTLQPFEWSLRTAIGVGLIIYGTCGYPLIGWAIGHGWPRSPMFGVAPCPTTIFTLGVLILAGRQLPIWAAVIPIAWALIGSTAAVLLGVWEDLGLLIAAAALPLTRNRRPTA